MEPREVVSGAREVSQVLRLLFGWMLHELRLRVDHQGVLAPDSRPVVRLREVEARERGES